MSEKRNLALILTIFLIYSCSTSQRLSQDTPSFSLIQKPNLSYDVNALPKNLLVYSSNEFSVDDISQELRGFLTNSYFFNSNISYEPKITFKYFSFIECKIENIKDGIIILFDMELFSSDAKQKCISQLNRSNVFYVAKNNTLGITNRFIVSPNSERDKLIETIPSALKKFGFIKKNNSYDYDSTKKLIAAEKLILSLTSFEDTEGSQDLFSQILLTDRSYDRKRKLSRRLSKNLEGYPRSRKDLDAFYFSVNLTEARALKPALDFISENRLNVYLLNSWESEESYNIENRDLVGSINADLPVMMPILLPNYLPRSARNRDFAIGYDTFQIILLKYGIDNLKGVSYKGLTGEISFSGRKILRKPYVFKITEEGYDIL